MVAYSIGSTLGGGSAINVMIFNRGSPHDFDNWANITGDASWKYENMLKHFRNVEDYQGDYPSSTQHGTGGPITITNPRYAPLLSDWLSAGRQLGYPIVDPNGPEAADSFGPQEFAKKFGRRVSSYIGYLKPILNSRQNIKVITRAVVTRVLLDGDRATGVVYKINGVGKEIQVQANREVILSAGVIESPPILMRSGIGPKDILQASGIKPVKDLPVGENLHDHPLVPLQIIVNEKLSPIFDPDRDLTPENFKIYNDTGDGPYSSYYGAQAQAFIVSCLHRKEAERNPSSIPRDWADIHIFSYVARGTPGIVDNLRIKPTMAPWENYFYTLSFVGRPKSKGRITLNTTDIEGNPNIDFQYFSDANQTDMGVVIEGIKKILQVFETTPAMHRIGARYPTNPLPACGSIPFRSDKYWQCYVKQLAASGLHGAGSCRMGSGPSDPQAVVDPTLKVIGFTNLRVVDASIMPDVVNPNTHAATYGIAEKASAMILESAEKNAHI